MTIRAPGGSATGIPSPHVCARPHLRAVYGFARLVDNIGDEAAGDRGALLDELERELEGPPRSEIMRRLHATIGDCGLPLEPFRRLIEANRIDQVRRRYQTWDDVREYCTYSADPVGRLVLDSFPIYLPLLALSFDASMSTSRDGDVRPG